jgi:micrococcal nuclease
VPTQPSTQGTCDPSYPDVCIPPPPPDLDCKDVPYADFRVIGADPHGFDGPYDGSIPYEPDGRGCEWN